MLNKSFNEFLKKSKLKIIQEFEHDLWYSWKALNEKDLMKVI